MAKKKGKGKGKKKKEDSGEDGAEMNPLQIALQFQAENKSLQRQLAMRTEEASKALASRKELQKKVAELKRDFDEEQDQTHELTADMTRQYKAMQEELLNRVNILENSITELKDQLDSSKRDTENMAEKKDQIIAAKDAEIESMKEKMEQMAQEFGDMLKETLDKMSSRIEISSSMMETEGALSMQKKLAEYNLG